MLRRQWKQSGRCFATADASRPLLRVRLRAASSDNLRNPMPETSVILQQISAPPAPGELKWPGHMADDVGATYGHEALAALTATADQLVLSGTRGHYRIPRSAVTKVGRASMYPWFFSGLRIHHGSASLPRELQFKPQPGNWREIAAQLKTLGYPVK